jgi:hypothetical protein
VKSLDFIKTSYPEYQYLVLHAGKDSHPYYLEHKSVPFYPADEICFGAQLAHYDDARFYVHAVHEKNGEPTNNMIGRQEPPVFRPQFLTQKLLVLLHGDVTIPSHPSSIHESLNYFKKFCGSSSGLPTKK